MENGIAYEKAMLLENLNYPFIHHYRLNVEVYPKNQ
jgi:hypothetical protein